MDFFLWLLITQWALCHVCVSSGLWLVVWPQEKPTCSASRLSMSWVSVMNPRSQHLWLSRLPLVSNAKYLLTTADVNHDNCPKPFHFKELKLNTVLTATPSAPYNIALLYCDGHSMILNWKKPLRSGGAKIKEYYVDKRRRGTTMWREVHIPPITERVYKVFGLFFITFKHQNKQKRATILHTYLHTLLIIYHTKVNIHIILFGMVWLFCAKLACSTLKVACPFCLNW